MTSLHTDSKQGPVAQWIRHQPTEPGIVGSSPTGVMHTCDTVVSFSVSSQNQITSVDVSGIFSSVVCNHQWLNFKRTLSKLSPSTPQHGGWPASSAASSTQVDHYQCVGILKPLSQWPSGPMDKASALGAGEYRFESCCSVVESTQVSHFCLRNPGARSHWPRGPMDKASAYRAGDCRFESCRGQPEPAHRRSVATYRRRLCGQTKSQTEQHFPRGHSTNGTPAATPTHCAAEKQ